MTDNPNRIPFEDMPREDQDRIAGAIARGDVVEWWGSDEWEIDEDSCVSHNIAYRIPLSTKPEKSIINITFKNVSITPYVKDRDFITYDGKYSNVGDMINRHVDATPEPAKDQNRPRPAHKLKLQKGDVVQHVGWQDSGDESNSWTYVVGRNAWLQGHIDTPLPKGQRPLFVVVFRAKNNT